MAFTLRQLETFVWVATLGNFRKTAERLYTTQPAISVRIANLEDTLGVKLFERNTGFVHLTAKGQQLLPFAENTLKMAARLVENTQESASISGIIRLGVSETIVYTLLPEFLTTLHHHYPNIDVEITVDVTTNLRNELIARILDIAFLMGPISEYKVENIRIPDVPLIWAASPNLGVNINEAVQVSTLTQFPILTYARNTKPYAEIANFFHKHCDMPIRIFPSNSLAACLQMAIDGIGIASLPHSMIENKLSEGSLILIPCEWEPTDLSFTASYSTTPLNPVNQAVIKVIEEFTNNLSSK